MSHEGCEKLGDEDEPDVAGLQRGKSKTGEAFSAGPGWRLTNLWKPV